LTVPEARNDGDVKVGGVILAAGASTRIGRPKQLLPVGGKPLLQYVVDAACGSSLSAVVVVLGHRASEIEARLVRGRATIVRCEDWQRGPGASLATGLAGLTSLTAPAGRERSGAAIDVAAILLADQPSVGAPLIDRVLRSWSLSERPVLRPTFVSHDGTRVPGHPVLVARTVWDQLASTEDPELADGARGWMRSNPHLVGELELQDALPRDIDTMNDYRALLSQDAPTQASTREA
jgi:molybdenum cofactor cytidylyltransferase